MRVSQETHQRAVTIMNAVLDQARSIWKSHAHLIKNLDLDWEVKAASTSGMAWKRKGLISLNPDYIGQDRFWNNTIKHEVAHHLQFWIYPNAKQSHGVEWRHIMTRLGGSTDARHCMTTPRLEVKKEKREANLVDYVCPTCAKPFKITLHRHNKIRRGTRYYCRSTRCRIANQPICLAGSVTKEVSVKEIMPEFQKLNLVTPPTPTPQPTGKVVGPAKLSDIISGGWWNS